MLKASTRGSVASAASAPPLGRRGFGMALAQRHDLLLEGRGGAIDLVRDCSGVRARKHLSQLVPCELDGVR
eukprot:4774587-Pyramimonas_sp.AAC.1